MSVLYFDGNVKWKVICLDETYDTAHAYRAGELSDIGLNTLALQDYNTAIRLNSSDMANYFNRAEVLLVCVQNRLNWVFTHVQIPQ